MVVVKEHAATVRNRTGKVRFARAMPTTNPRTGMLWERDWVQTDCDRDHSLTLKNGELTWKAGLCSVCMKESNYKIM